jgi:hypothetical protein
MWGKLGDTGNKGGSKALKGKVQVKGTPEPEKKGKVAEKSNKQLSFIRVDSVETLVKVTASSNEPMKPTESNVVNLRGLPKRTQAREPNRTSTNNNFTLVASKNPMRNEARVKRDAQIKMDNKKKKFSNFFVLRTITWDDHRRIMVHYGNWKIPRECDLNVQEGLETAVKQFRGKELMVPAVLRLWSILSNNVAVFFHPAVNMYKVFHQEETIVTGQGWNKNKTLGSAWAGLEQEVFERKSSSEEFQELEVTIVF